MQEGRFLSIELMNAADARWQVSIFDGGDFTLPEKEIRGIRQTHIVWQPFEVAVGLLLLYADALKK